jgi:chromosome partitioning protein
VKGAFLLYEGRRMAIAIAICNWKGGVAKTTTAVSVAHGLALSGRRVLLVDMDPQGHCSKALGLDQESGVFNLLVNDSSLEMVLRPTGREHLTILPGDKRTSSAHYLMNLERQPLSRVEEILQPATKNGSGFEYVIFDTAPSVGGLQDQAIWASDMVLIPCACDFLSADGVQQIIDSMEFLVEHHHWEGYLMGVLPTFYDEVTTESQATLHELQEQFRDRVLMPIHRATVLRQCAAEGRTVFEVDSKSRAAAEYSALVHYVMEKIR